MKNRTKNVIIALCLVVIIVQSAGLVYLWGLEPPSSEELTTLVVGQTQVMGRNVHPQFLTAGDNAIVNNIFEGLLDYEGRTLELKPVLAENLGEVSSDGLEYTFTLRQGIFFHDGTPFNATAVHDHFSRMFDIQQGMAYMYISGLLNHTEVVDTYTAKFVLNYANSDFRHMLAFVTAYIPSPTATERYGVEGIRDHPIGTGPFKFVSKIVDSRVLMEANENWWQIGNGKEIGIDRLLFVHISDPGTAKLAIEAGEIHATMGNLLASDYPDLLENPSLTTHDVTSSEFRRWITWQMNSSLWDHFPNKKVRQAFAYAIPYDVIISNIYGGRAERQYSYLPPEYPEYKQVLDRYEYNATKAIELIQEAGFETPLAVDFHLNAAFAENPDIAALIKQYADQAGFDITIHITEVAAYKQRWYDTAEQEINLWEWSAQYASTDAWNVPMLHSQGWSLKNTHAVSGDMAGICPYIDDLIAECAGTTNQTRKAEIMDELQELHAEWLPNVYMWRAEKYQFTRANVKGVVYGVLAYHDVEFWNATIT